MTGGRERDQLAAPVIGVRAAFDQAVSFQLVDDQGGVGGVDAVGRRELLSLPDDHGEHAS
jgi:hypothetical protein